MPVFIDLTGRVFGRLTVMKRHPRNTSDGRAKWLCKCNCGNTDKVVVILGASLRRGLVISCGCYRVEQSTKSSMRHGFSINRKNNPEYSTWLGLRQRCNNPKCPQYEHYGGRGINCCARWNKFENFLMDMGRRPIGHSLDRIDVNGHYEPSNCRWASRDTQANNKQQKYTLFEAAKILGVELK